MGEIVKMSFELREKLEGNGRLNESFKFLKKVGPQGLVSPHPGAIYMFITMTYQDFLSGFCGRAFKSVVS